MTDTPDVTTAQSTQGDRTMTDNYLIKYAKQFDKHVKDHTLTVRDQGRGPILLKVRSPSCQYGYDIVSWRGVVCLHGSMGSFMFDGGFMDISKYHKRMGVDCENLLDRARSATSFLHDRTISACADRQQFCFDLFIKELNTELKDFRKRYPEVSQEQIDRLFKELEEHEGSDSPEEIHRVCQMWSDDVTGCSEELLDIHDIKLCRVYRYQFTWNCLAVAHAIKLYNEHKAREAI